MYSVKENICCIPPAVSMDLPRRVFAVHRLLKLRNTEYCELIGICGKELTDSCYVEGLNCEYLQNTPERSDGRILYSCIFNYLLFNIIPTFGQIILK
jgi:hypothetical protein